MWLKIEILKPWIIKRNKPLDFYYFMYRPGIWVKKETNQNPIKPISVQVCDWNWGSWDAADLRDSAQTPPIIPNPPLTPEKYFKKCEALIAKPKL